MKARKAKELFWPRTETKMSLVGYDHVFRDAVECELGTGVKVRVVTLVTLVLLKVASYMDAPQTREKDLQDLATIMERYEAEGDRRFTDEVLDADVEYDSTGAFLLGRDLARLCDEQDEVAVVERFLKEVSDSDHPTFIKLSRLARRTSANKDELLLREIGALTRGFGENPRRK
jgi:predicted nucleotidyltransferase